MLSDINDTLQSSNQKLLDIEKKIQTIEHVDVGITVGEHEYRS